MMCLILIISRLFCFNGGLSKEMMGLIGAGNNPQVLMTVAASVAIEEASK
jgi:hypothetical protein